MSHQNFFSFFVFFCITSILAVPGPLQKRKTCAGQISNDKKEVGDLKEPQVQHANVPGIVERSASSQNFSTVIWSFESPSLSSDDSYQYYHRPILGLDGSDFQIVRCNIYIWNILNYLSLKSLRCVGQLRTSSNLENFRTMLTVKMFVKFVNPKKSLILNLGKSIFGQLLVAFSKRSLVSLRL